jgi:hypothetical protein
MDQIPNEIFVRFFEFLSESDKRKLSLTCSWLNNIYQKFCTLLPHQVQLQKLDFSDFRILGWSCWLKFQFFEANEKFFDILGPKPVILVKVNDDPLNYPVYFPRDLINLTREQYDTKDAVYKYPDFSSCQNVNVKIVKTHNCRLKFTHYHSQMYYVDGCTLSEIHSRQKYPCFRCHTFEAIDSRFNTSWFFPRSPTITKNDNYLMGRRVRYSLMGKRIKDV